MHLSEPDDNDEAFSGAEQGRIAVDIFNMAKQFSFDSETLVVRTMMAWVNSGGRFHYHGRFR